MSHIVVNLSIVLFLAAVSVSAAPQVEPAPSLPVAGQPDRF